MLGDFVPLGPAEPKRRETTAGGRRGSGQWGEHAWVVCDDNDDSDSHKAEEEKKPECKQEDTAVKWEPVQRVVRHAEGENGEEEEEEEEKHVDRERRRQAQDSRRSSRSRRRRREREREREEDKEGWTGGVEVRGVRAEFPAGAIDAPQYGVENFRLEVAAHHTSACGTQFVECDGTLSPCDPLSVYPTRMVPARVEPGGRGASGTVVLLFEQGWRVNARRVELTLEYSQHPYTAKLLDCTVLDLAPARAAAAADEHYPADAAARYVGQQRLHYALAQPLPARLHSPVAGTVALRLAARPVAAWHALADPDAPVPVPYETPDDL